MYSDNDDYDFNTDLAVAIVELANSDTLIDEDNWVIS